jgi:hypothetical protein
MVLTRSLLLAAACALPLSIVACGGSSSGDTPIVPEGTHYGYVVSKANVPVDNKTATSYGLDLGSSKSGTLDGTVDNHLGQVLGFLSTMTDIQKAVTDAINAGSIILLVDFQTKDFMNSSAAGLSVKIGTMPVPAACTNPLDLTTCGKHLDGNASFSIDPKSPTDALVAGKIVNGTFNGGPGNIDLQIALGTTQPITLSLLNARAKATAITADGMTATIGGALPVNDLNTQVIPAIQVQVAGILDADCDPVANRVPPGCGCKTGSTGTLLTLFDGDDGTTKDCQISVAELAGNSTLKSLLGPDICSTTTCTAPDALSLGIQVQTVKAMFPTM